MPALHLYLVRGHLQHVAILHDHASMSGPTKCREISCKLIPKTMLHAEGAQGLNKNGVKLNMQTNYTKYNTAQLHATHRCMTSLSYTGNTHPHQQLPDVANQLWPWDLTMAPRLVCHLPAIHEIFHWAHTHLDAGWLFSAKLSLNVEICSQLHISDLNRNKRQPLESL